MTQPTFACLLTEDAVTILCLRQGRWQVEPIGGEASTPLATPLVVPEVLKQLSERLNLPGDLRHVRLFVVYADGVASHLPAALAGMAKLNATPVELLRRDRLAPDAHHSNANTIMALLLSDTKSAHAGHTPASPPAPVTAQAPFAPAAPPIATAVPTSTRFYIVDTGPGQPSLVYDSSNGLLWPSKAAADGPLTITEATRVAAGLRLAGMPHWRLPEQHELEQFAQADQPLRDHRRQTMLERWNWLCTQGRLDMVKGVLAPAASGHLLPVLDLARGRPYTEFAALAGNYGWQVAPWSA